jgi:biopolymer transport protein ExbB
MIALLALQALGAEPSPLEQAYQKEYAYLHAEKVEVQRRISEFETEAFERLARASGEIEALQTKLVATTRLADQAEDSFDALDREIVAMDDSSTLLSTSVDQARETLGLPSVEDRLAAVPEVFTVAGQAIAKASAVGWTEGAFFLPDGRQVQGRIYTWGQVAAWGLSPEGQGALVPVGEGRLQLRRDFGQATVAALESGSGPERLELQLFEPERAAEEAEEAGGLGQLLHDAGTMGQVLFGLGVVSAILVVIRAVTLLLAWRGGMPLFDKVSEHLRAGRVEQARALVARRDTPAARVAGAIVDGSERSPVELERIVDEALLRETPGIDRFASALVVITAGSPLLGLLGTVTGMIATFDVITEHGTGNPKLMSAGIAEALICTALGLSVAIPTLLAGNVLASVADSVKNVLERGALALLNTLELRRRRPHGADRPTMRPDADEVTDHSLAVSP